MGARRYNQWKTVGFGDCYNPGSLTIAIVIDRVMTQSAPFRSCYGHYMTLHT